MFNVINNLSEDYYPPSAPTTISGFIVTALNFVIGIGFALAFLSLAWACYQYIMSKGDPKAVQQAWNSVVYSGFAIAISFGVLVFRLIALRLLGVTTPALVANDPVF